VFEAGFYPGIILYSPTGTERAAREAFGMFMSASGVAGVIGGPLAGLVMNGLHGVNGWAAGTGVPDRRVPSVIASVVTWYYLTDRPSQAQWPHAGCTPARRTTSRVTARRSVTARRPASRR